MLIQPDVFASIRLGPGGTIATPIKKRRSITLAGIVRFFMVHADPFSVRRCEMTNLPQDDGRLISPQDVQAIPPAEGSAALRRTVFFAALPERQFIARFAV